MFPHHCLNLWLFFFLCKATCPSGDATRGMYDWSSADACDGSGPCRSAKINQLDCGDGDGRDWLGLGMAWMWTYMKWPDEFGNKDPWSRLSSNLRVPRVPRTAKFWQKWPNGSDGKNGKRFKFQPRPNDNNQNLWILNTQHWSQRIIIMRQVDHSSAFSQWMIM